MDLLLALLLRLEGGLVLGESAAEGTGEAGSEVKRSVLLVLVEQTELGALVGVDDGENASDRLANVVDSLSLRRGTGSDLLDTELGELGLQLLELLGKFFLALSPELTSLDLGCRLKFISITNPQRLRKKSPIRKNCAFNIPWWADING